MKILLASEGDTIFNLLANNNKQHGKKDILSQQYIEEVYFRLMDFITQTPEEYLKYEENIKDINSHKKSSIIADEDLIKLNQNKQQNSKIFSHFDQNNGGNYNYMANRPNPLKLTQSNHYVGNSTKNEMQIEDPKTNNHNDLLASDEVLLNLFFNTYF